VLTAVNSNVTGATRMTGKLTYEEEYRNKNHNGIERGTSFD
jgi:hypothetical protein